MLEISEIKKSPRFRILPPSDTEHAALEAIAVDDGKPKLKEWFPSTLEFSRLQSQKLPQVFAAIHGILLK